MNEARGASTGASVSNTLGVAHPDGVLPAAAGLSRSTLPSDMNVLADGEGESASGESMPVLTDQPIGPSAASSVWANMAGTRTSPAGRPAPEGPPDASIVMESRKRSSGSRREQAEDEPEELAEMRRAEEDARAFAERGAPPVRPGQIIRCSNFEGKKVAARVYRIHQEEPLLAVYIPALRRFWPIRFEDMEGEFWIHDAAKYPPPGAEPDFDRRFRQERPSSADPLDEGEEDEAGAGASITKEARGGHVWARIKMTAKAVGFDVHGKQKTTWAADEMGEFETKLVDTHPNVFESMTKASFFQALGRKLGAGRRPHPLSREGRLARGDAAPKAARPHRSAKTTKVDPRERLLESARQRRIDADEQRRREQEHGMKDGLEEDEANEDEDEDENEE